MTSRAGSTLKRHPWQNRAMTSALRFRGALALLVAFNVLTVGLMLVAGIPPEPLVFAAWFVGDAVIGLIVLGLTDAR